MTGEMRGISFIAVIGGFGLATLFPVAGQTPGNSRAADRPMPSLHATPAIEPDPSAIEPSLAVAPRSETVIGIEMPSAPHDDRPMPTLHAIPAITSDPTTAEVPLAVAPRSETIVSFDIPSAGVEAAPTLRSDIALPLQDLPAIRSLPTLRLRAR